MGDVTWGEHFELVGRLQKKVLAITETRKKKLPDPAAGVFVRASSLGYFCAREEALIELAAGEAQKPVVREETHDADTLWRFAIGHATHGALQNRIMPHVGSEWQGWWLCDECHHVHKGPPTEGISVRWGWIPKPERCAECGHPELLYKELSFRNSEYILTGHIDGIMAWRTVAVIDGVEVQQPTPDIELIDFKTVDPMAFRYRDPRKGGKPMETHLWQLTAYLWACGLTRGRLVYVEKKQDPDVFDNWVEHEVTLEPERLESIKTMLLDTKRYFGGDKSELPARVFGCTSRKCRRAQKCTMRKGCWT